MLARDQLRQILALLCLGSVAPDLIDTEIGVGAVGEADRSGAAADLLHRDAMREVAHSGAAIFFFDGDAVQAERAHLGPQLDGKPVGPVDLGGERRDPVLGKAANRGPQHVDLRAEIKIERGEPRVLHGSAAGGCGWCGREDSNFHGVSPTATSTLRVYQFRHDRTAGPA